MADTAASTTDLRRHGVGFWPAVPQGLTADQQAFLDLLNAARADPPGYGRRVGVDLTGVPARPPLGWSPNLAAGADGHSRDMAAKDYFGHAGSDGSNPGQRMASAGYSWLTWAESIAAGTPTPADTLALLVRDPGVADAGHRKMLLGIGQPYATLAEVGVASARGGRYGVVWTIDAAAPSGRQPPPDPAPDPPRRRRNPWRPRWWPARWAWPVLATEEREAAGVPRSPGWPHARAEHLRREPRCRGCGGRKRLAVHHKLPYHLRPDLELDPANLITLCEDPARLCHFRLGHLFDWASYNPNVEADADAQLAAILRRPKAGAA